jgi:hypothetical protein
MAHVEICFPEGQHYRSLIVSLHEGATIAQILQQTKLEHLIAKGLNIGIWGKIAALDTILHAGDRIEIYLPLQIDPKSLRRQNAKKQRSNNVDR